MRLGRGGQLHDECHPITFQIEFVQATGSVFQEIAFPLSCQVENVVSLPLVVNREGCPLKALIKQQKHRLVMACSRCNRSIPNRAPNDATRSICEVCLGSSERVGRGIE